MQHISVLLHEAIDGLAMESGDTVVDGTLGHGGHTASVFERYGNSVGLVGIDMDSDAILRSKNRLTALGADVTYIEGSFRNIGALLKQAGFEKVNKILLDIGLSSNQFEESGRGFSFQKNEPLIMSFKKDLTPEDLTAREIVNTWSQESITDILSGYGEEQFAWKIARAICERREIQPIETTFDLVSIIQSATPPFYHHRKIHPATKTFQALRITVNDEIESLKDGLKHSMEMLAENGRLAVISFHSLEDRVVKQYFKTIEEEGIGKRITKKPILPTEEETQENPRARSAKLRIISKL